MTDNVEPFDLYFNKIGTPAELKELYSTGRLSPSLGAKWVAEKDAQKRRADEIFGAALKQMDKEGLGNQAQSEAIGDLFDDTFGGDEETRSGPRGRRSNSNCVEHNDE